MTHKKLSLAEVTDEVISQWKANYGKITKYKTADGKVVFFRSPERAEIAAAEAAKLESDNITSNEVLCKAMALGGDLEILSMNKYIFGLGKHIAKFLDRVEGETEEL